jgi:hypothetical protein
MKELFPRHCEELLRRSNPFIGACRDGLLRCARNDAFKHLIPLATFSVPARIPRCRIKTAEGGKSRRACQVRIPAFVHLFSRHFRRQAWKIRRLLLLS